jgi:RNase P/RNase MRP subunit p29
MISEELIGKKALFVYDDSNKLVQCFGIILDIDDCFFAVRTKENKLLIPKKSIKKVKLREGELVEDGTIIKS